VPNDENVTARIVAKTIRRAKVGVMKGWIGRAVAKPVVVVDHCMVNIGVAATMLSIV